MAWPRASFAVPLATACAVWLAACPPCADCAGCCTHGQCLPGNSGSACGFGGAACISCGAGQVCRAGACVSRDAGTPDAGRPRICQCVSGCCREDGGCAPGNRPEACGTRGRFCFSCDAGQMCPAGQCLDVESCGGCFDALGLCRPGNTPSACGSGGVPCQGCVGTDTCVSGRCTGTSSCGAANCPTGCCASANVCVPSSPAQCGTGGAPCVTCPDGGDCLDGRCQ